MAPMMGLMPKSDDADDHHYYFQAAFTALAKYERARQASRTPARGRAHTCEYAEATPGASKAPPGASVALI